MLLLRITECLNKAKVKFAVVGGFAVALHGAVRGTFDVDIALTLEEAEFQRGVEALRAIGFESRIPLVASEVIKFRKEFIEKRNLIAWSFYNPKMQSEVVYVLLTVDAEDLRIETVKVHGVKVPIASIGDLIKMKLKSGRPQDLEDVKALQNIVRSKR